MKTEKNNLIKEHIAPKLDALTDEQLDNVNAGLDLPDAFLQTLKDKAITAVNDTNTDVDRESIQKEIDHSLAQIDDNALTIFNGKKLNN